MKINEIITEKKSRKKSKVRQARYKPGLYGGYGYFSNYGNSDSTSDGGGDGGGGDGGGESIRENITPNTIHKLADRKGVKWDNEPSFLRLTKRLTGKEHLDDLDQVGLQKVKRHLDGLQGVAEGSDIQIPTADGITMQDIRLMAGEGKLSKKTVLQAIAVIRKQRKEQGVAEELDEEFDIIENIIEDIAGRNGVDAEAIWEDLESLSDDELYVFAVTTPVMEDWQKANQKDRTDGMSQKAVNAYRRENPGSKLKTAVTTKPSKLKKGSKASKRRKSYCSRSRGQMKMHSISCAKTPDKAICKARRRWNC